MVLPSKHLHQSRALLTIGAEVIRGLAEPRTVSALWEEFRMSGAESLGAPPRLTYDWFVLALDLLFAFGAIEISNGLLRVPTRDTSDL